MFGNFPLDGKGLFQKIQTMEQKSRTIEIRKEQDTQQPTYMIKPMFPAKNGENSQYMQSDNEVTRNYQTAANIESQYITNMFLQEGFQSNESISMDRAIEERTGINSTAGNINMKPSVITIQSKFKEKKPSRVDMNLSFNSHTIGNKMQT